MLTAGLEGEGDLRGFRAGGAGGEGAGPEKSLGVEVSRAVGLGGGGARVTLAEPEGRDLALGTLPAPLSAAGRAGEDGEGTWHTGCTVPSPRPSGSRPPGP